MATESKKGAAEGDRKFFRWEQRSPSSPGRWNLDIADTDIFDRKLTRRLYEGRALGAREWPDPAPEFTYDKATTFQDMPYARPELVVSDRLRLFLEAEAPGALQFLPLRLRGPRSAEAGPYWIMNCLCAFKCMVEDPVIDSSRIPEDGIVGRIQGDDTWHRVIIRADLKRKIEKAGFTGILFEKEHDVTTKRVVVNKKTGKREKVEPELDPQSLRFDVNAYFAAGKGANDVVDGSGSTAFHTYVCLRSAHGNLDPRVVLRFLKEGADPNVANRAENLSAIFVMLNPKTPELVRAFAAHGADVNAANTMNEHTVLMSAVSAGDPKVCEELIRLGAHVNAVDFAGQTALHHVVDDGCWDDQPVNEIRRIVELLVKKGADLEIMDGEERTPLALAVVRWAGNPDRKHDEIAEWLLDAGANPNCRLGAKNRSKLATDGGTPLMCQRYEKGALHLALLKAGADPTLTCPKGLTAMDYAEKRIKAKAEDARGAEKALKAMRDAAAKRK